MSKCPSLESLALCGNPLSEETGQADAATSSDSEDETEQGQRRPAWPTMPQMQHADFRSCGLASADEQELRSALPRHASLQLKAALSTQTGKHIIFDSSS